MQAHNPMQEAPMAKKRPTAIAKNPADETKAPVGVLDPPAVEHIDGALEIEFDGAEAPIAFGPSLMVCEPGTINAPDGAELVAEWWLPGGRHSQIRKYAIDDWRVYDSHQEHPTQHQNMPAAFGQLVRAFHFRARSWWTERAT
jgi:hypothetical protein